MPGLFFGEGNGEGNGQGNGGNALWTGLGSAPLSEPLNVAVRWKTFLPTSGQYGYPDRWWSPMLRAQVVMGEFADKGGLRAVTLAAPNNDPAQMADEIFKLAQKFAHRELRLPEIIAQSDSFVDYWYPVADGGQRAAAQHRHTGAGRGGRRRTCGDMPRRTNTNVCARLRFTRR